MCNQEEKCKEMRRSALKVLTEELKKARQKEKFNISKRVMELIEKEVSALDCQPCSELRQRIEAYDTAGNLYERMGIIDMLIAELEAFLKD